MEHGVSFLAERRRSLSRLSAKISKLALGAMLLGTALIEEACHLMRGQIEEAEAQKMLEELVRAHLRDDVGS